MTGVQEHAAALAALSKRITALERAASRDDLKATVYACVEHGATAGTPRPTGYAGVIWYGSVAPTNAVAPDIVIRTDEAV